MIFDTESRPPKLWHMILDTAQGGLAMWGKKQLKTAVFYTQKRTPQNCDDNELTQKEGVLLCGEK